MLVLAWLQGAAAAIPLNDPSRPYTLSLAIEAGFVAPLAHRVQLGAAGDRLDYVADGGQDHLFPLVRPTVALRWRRQVFTARWQPLELRTTATLGTALQLDDVVFPADRPIALRYGGSFWRLSWGYRIADRGDRELSVGLGVQLRSAILVFTSADGSLGLERRSLGATPTIEAEARRSYLDGVFVEAEADGSYLPIRYLDGRSVQRAFADLQLRIGLQLASPTQGFVGLRYLAVGTSGETRDGSTEDWLHALIVTLGGRVR